MISNFSDLVNNKNVFLIPNNSDNRLATQKAVVDVLSESEGEYNIVNNSSKLENIRYLVIDLFSSPMTLSTNEYIFEVVLKTINFNLFDNQVDALAKIKQSFENIKHHGLPSAFLDALIGVILHMHLTQVLSKGHLNFKGFNFNSEASRARMYNALNQIRLTSPNKITVGRCKKLLEEFGPEKPFKLVTIDIAFGYHDTTELMTNIAIGLSELGRMIRKVNGGNFENIIKTTDAISKSADLLFYRFKTGNHTAMPTELIEGLPHPVKYTPGSDAMRVAFNKEVEDLNRQIADMKRRFGLD